LGEVATQKGSRGANTAPEIYDLLWLLPTAAAVPVSAHIENFILRKKSRCLTGGANIFSVQLLVLESEVVELG
jgi:hypothetical protein